MQTDAAAAEPEGAANAAQTIDERGSERLIASAAKWMAEALNAWSDDDYAKVAVLAPLAVEHLGTAALWRAKPVLLVPLSADAENALFSLAMQPDIASPKLRTVGLAILLKRLEKLLGGLPINPTHRTRMVDVRNGAIRVGSATQSRHVLLDSLAMCEVLLRSIGQEPEEFYGDHHADTIALLDQKQTEVGHRVIAKLARGRRNLSDLEERIGVDNFGEITDHLEDLAPQALSSDDFGTGLWAVPTACPECDSHGQLFGHVDVEQGVDYDVEALGNGEYESNPIPGEWTVTLIPRAFACNVCRLTLHGPDELQAARLPASRYEVGPEDLSEDFDPELYAESVYGLRD
jgi:hypothetical protein